MNFVKLCYDFTMKLANGGDLRKLIKDQAGMNRLFPSLWVADLFAQACSALKYTHEEVNQFQKLHKTKTLFKIKDFQML